MGGVEFGLKQGRFGFGFKQSVQELICRETSWAGNGQNGVVFAGDESFVDQFLNLQNADNPQEVDHPENLQINNKTSSFLPPPPSPLQPTAAAGEEDLCSVLTLPEEEPELEWLSQFMEDSFSPPYPAAAGNPPQPAKPSSENETPASISPQAAIPWSRRSKRCRLSCGPVWPIPSSATESTTSSSSSSSTSSPWQPTSPSTPLEIQTRAPKPNPNKKHNNRVGPGLKPASGPVVLARRCSHCGSQKTPQWRAGPTGERTLCNACGVRFKSGRLFPEYRPASSPTFSSEAHSNSHRKVLEMRKKKEMTGRPEPGFESALTSFG